MNYSDRRPFILTIARRFPVESRLRGCTCLTIHESYEEQDRDTVVQHEFKIQATLKMF